MSILMLSYYFALSVMLLAFAYCCGIFLHYAIRRRPTYYNYPFKIFINSSIGLIIIVFVYSLITTKLHTVNVVLATVLAFYIFYLFKKEKSFAIKQPDRDHKVFIYSIIAMLLLFIFQLTSIYNFGTKSFTDTFCDYHFYAKTALYLNKGFENARQFANIAFSQGILCEPYHYFDIWLAAFVAKSLGIPIQIAMSIVVPVALGGLAIMGMFAFAKKINITTATIAILFYFLTIFTIFYELLSKLGFATEVDMLGGNVFAMALTPKLLPAFIFIIFSLNALLRRDYLLAIIALMTIPVLSITIAPQFIAFVALAIITFYIYNKKRNGYVLLFTLAYLASFLLVYIFIWTLPNGGMDFRIHTFEEYLNYIIFPLKYILFVSPFIVLAIYSLVAERILNKKIIKIILFSTLFLIFSSIALFLSACSSFDAFQFFSNLFIPLVTALLALIYIRGIQKSSRITTKILIIIMVVVVAMSLKTTFRNAYEYKFQKLETSFVAKANEEFKNKNIYAGFINSKEYYDRFFLLSLSNVFGVGEVFLYHSNSYNDIGLSDFTALDNLKNRQNISDNNRQYAINRLKDEIFYRYATSKENKDLSITQNQVNFIKKYHLNYLFIQNNVIPSDTLLNILETVVAEKETTGYTLYKVK